MCNLNHLRRCKTKIYTHEHEAKTIWIVKQEPSAYKNQTIKTFIAWRQQRADVPLAVESPL